MAFFTKLKDRLFKTSSKLEEGLDAIVADGGDQPGETPPQAPPEAPAPKAPPEAPQPDAPPEAPEPDLPPEAPQPDAPDETPVPDTPREMPPTPAPDLPRPATPEPRPDLPETPRPDPAPDGIPGTTPTEVPQTPDVTPQPEPVGVPMPGSAGNTMPLEIPLQDLPNGHGNTPSDAPARAEGGLLGRLFRGNAPAAVPRRVLDDDMVESLEELLISADMGVDTALRVTANMAEGRYGRRVSTQEIKELLAHEIAAIMEPVARPLPIYPTRPQVVLVVGVNGSGKTTTIGKLASQFRAAEKSVVIAAGDTFRAAAVEQLQVWGDRAGVPVLTAPEGSDPASLAFDAMTRAQADGADLLLIDTAGRLQNRADLMEELSKIVRVIRKKDPEAPHNTLLVLDATTGQNAINQVETFRKLADVSGLVMTKLDGTAKGGVLVALADKFGLPIHAIGVGEQIDDLAPFDPEEFAAALTGLAR
ncbi:signal recognition particle-docking protein FtsY [Pacificitalea manganoxidans]|uniref:Signal recognition particle receptor FtsY n=1 Tax=Pacificitalea manganoxidans TaxID=1411902 RepID=A0A291LXP5_9RHOB|nr:signal recognition particle-docking protein FtsY [Pacificitalea manganoxidans]ATI41450.1 signal recognition particle-docking protein FtsY [Pacificitalea manganoxidans]MDR6308865.1 fused signal recognition particle receptor [Pacificitalea manganoxidans]